MIFLSNFLFDKTFKVQESVENFALVFDEVDSIMPVVVIEEGEEISTLAKTYILCQNTYIRTYSVELVSAPVTLGWKRKSVLLPKFADGILVSTANLEASDS